MAGDGKKGFPKDLYERYKQDGFTDEEIDKMWEDTLVMRELYYNNPQKDQREVSCSTYENAQRRLTKEVERWLADD